MININKKSKINIFCSMSLTEQKPFVLKRNFHDSGDDEAIDETDLCDDKID